MFSIVQLSSISIIWCLTIIQLYYYDLTMYIYIYCMYVYIYICIYIYTQYGRTECDRPTTFTRCIDVDITPSSQLPGTRPQHAVDRWSTSGGAQGTDAGRKVDVLENWGHQQLEVMSNVPGISICWDDSDGSKWFEEKSDVFVYLRLKYNTQKPVGWTLDQLYSCPRIPFFRGTVYGKWDDGCSGQGTGLVNW